MAKIKSTNLDTTVVTLINTTVSTGVANVVPGAVATAVSNIPVAANAAPRISSIQITDSNYAAIDDTAVSINGGFVIINGSGFVNGCSVLVNNTLASAVAFVSSTQLRVQLPASPAGTYVVYLLNPDGAVAIRVNGVSFSAMPTWTTANTLTQGVVSIPISIQLAATSNSAITYTLQSGSTLPAGLSLSSSGLLSGTVTGISVETTYNFTVVATDAELQDTPRAFSITITVGDSNFRNVTALLSATTPATTFVNDSSTNNFNVAIFGDTRPTNFGPYTPGYYSNFFDGNFDYLDTPTNAAFGFGTGDFTIEVWVYPTGGNSSNGYYVIDFRPVGNGSATRSSIAFGTSTVAGGALVYQIGTPAVITGPLLPAGQWYHIAVSRSGSNTRMFVNGSQVGSTYTTLDDLGSTARPLIGNVGDAPTTYNASMLGYISNVRVIKGTALYTANFTPPTTPLTAIANTSLLTCQSNRFIDNSTNNFTVTKNGDITVSGFVPYVLDANFAGRGSGFFDGTGDWINTPATSALEFGSGDFTIECWINPADTTRRAIYHGSSGTDWSLGIDFQSQKVCIWASSNGSSWNLINADGGGNGIGTITVPINSWTHVAFVRSGTTWQTYINGIRDLNLTGISGTLVDRSASAKSIGKWWFTNGVGTPTMWNGYISDFRALKGTAVYTANFTPPAAPLTAVANTSLLTLQNNQPTNNSMFLDASTTALNITRNGNSTQGSFSPYGGGWSMASSNGSQATVPSSSWTTFSGQFTIEAWLFYNTAPSAGWGVGGSTSGMLIPFYYTGSAFAVNIFGTGNIFVSTASAPVGRWFHIAVTRNASNLMTMWIDGVSVGSATNSSSFTQGVFNIGPGGNGFVSNVRMVSGIALYTSSFTPPTAPLTAIANTQLLTCADNRFIDDSANNFAITSSGDVRVERFNPFNPVVTTPTTYSAYFDGTGDTISAASDTNLIFGTGDFTAECWINSGSQLGSFNTIIGGDTNGAMLLSITGSGTSTGVAVNPYGTANVYNQSYTFTQGTWFHLAVTRSGTSLRVFVNGTQLGSTVTDSTNFSAATRIIGGAGTSLQNFAGYVSNARIVKGTAVYTSNFTPPTSPLTAIANTSLLTCQSATFVDASTNNFAITATGDAVPRQFNPFGQTSTITAYTPAVYGGSAYFDGSDWLSLPSNSVFNQNTTFTLECWVYGTGYFYAQNLSGFLTLIFNSNGSVTVDKSFVGPTITSAAGSGNANAWNHIALVFDGTNHRLFVNGILRGTASGGGVASGTTQTIGRYDSGPNHFTGYMSDLRIIRGRALYTSNFAPPVAPLRATPDTVFMLSMAGAGIYDSAGINNFETVGDARINTTIKRYSNASLFFDGTGDRIYRADPSPNFGFGTGDYTVEFWLYVISSPASKYTLVDFRTTTNAQTHTIYVTSTGFMGFFNGSADVTSSGQPITTGAWFHVAYSRSSGTLRIFVNGAQAYSAANTVDYQATRPITIGGSVGGGGAGEDLNGYIADFRITKGVARYTAAFTPTSSPFIAR